MSNRRSDAEVSEAIRRRYKKLRLDPAAVKRRGGPTDKPLKSYLEGGPIGSPSAERRLCAALRWSPDSIELLRQGLEPIELPEESVDLAQLRAEVEAVKKAIVAIESLLP